MAEEKKEEPRKADAVMVSFIKDTSIRTSLTARHLQNCRSLRRRKDSARGMECDHGYYWGLNAGEMGKLM